MVGYEEGACRVGRGWRLVRALYVQKMRSLCLFAFSLRIRLHAGQKSQKFYIPFSLVWHVHGRGKVVAGHGKGDR